MLNAAQRTNLGIVMRMIEEKMRAIEFRLSHPSEHALMFDVRDDLPPMMTGVLREKIAEVYALIEWLRDGLGLPREVKTASQDVRTGLAQRWVSLQESVAEQLRRYGEVDPSVAPVLDPKIEALARLMIEMDDTVLVGSRPMSGDGSHERPR